MRDHGLTWFSFVIVAWFVYSAVLVWQGVGRPREPIRVTLVEKRTQHPCYFQGVHVELGDQTITLSHNGRTVPTGRKIGSQPCSGPPEYSYAVQPMHPAHVLTSVKVCPAHVGALQELAAALGDGTDGYWIVPND